MEGSGIGSGLPVYIHRELVDARSEIAKLKLAARSRGGDTRLAQRGDLYRCSRNCPPGGNLQCASPGGDQGLLRLETTQAGEQKQPCENRCAAPHAAADWSWDGEIRQQGFSSGWIEAGMRPAQS